MEKPHVVILGAGYGVMITAVNLQKSLSANEASITLVNKHEYHYQSTALHESAAGTLHHDQTRVPIKDVINMSKIDFVQDTVVSIDPREKKVTLADGELTYDILIVSLGFEADTFGIPGLDENNFMLGRVIHTILLGLYIVD